ncbi:MAG: phosphoribulokinase [Methanotrichaceae archaeon]|nr:phosphoribulokinase [Methanotrichaceae archaeon]
MSSLIQEIINSRKVFIFGIAGDSGSGKTTISNGIKRVLGENLAVIFSMDDYHIIDRKQRKRLNITPLDPQANNLDLLATHLETLKAGKQIEKPVYDHGNGQLMGTVPFGPAPIIIMEGLHPFYTERLRRLIDFKIFIDPSRQVKRIWKIRRDVDIRGYNPNEVMSEILRREPDYKLYVDIQKIYAEIVIKIQSSRFDQPLMGPKREWYSVRLIQQMVEQLVSRVDLTIDLSKILQMSEHEFSIEFQRDDYYGKKVGIMTIDGEIHQNMIVDLERKLCNIVNTQSEIADRYREHVNAIGLAQVILTWRCAEKLEHLMRCSIADGKI